jgi:protocatechuate 3,4-dioxygenase, beta subunit
MPSPITPHLIGRRVLESAGLAIALLPVTDAIAQPAPLPAMPRQTTGPFYPLDWSGDVDADLVRMAGEAAQAQGTVTHLRGRVLNVQGEPTPGAVIEIWQCDAFGHYRNPRDRQDGRDAGFQGRGRVAVGANGGFAFRTIRPVPYPGRTPHIHVTVAAPADVNRW